MPREAKVKFAETRRQEIAAIVMERKVVTVDELCSLLSVSAATIRSDLTELECQGVLQRTHGGAIYNQNCLEYEQTSIEKEVQNIEQKQAIARAALCYVRPGDVIGLDTGTTILELAKLLADIPDLTVITNDLKIAAVLETESRANIMLLGGFIRKHFHCTIGQSVSNALRDLHMDTLFLATNGMSVRRGFSTPSIDIAGIKREMIASATQTITLADSSKVNREAMVTFGALKDTGILISDGGLDRDFADAAEQAGVEVIRVDA